MGGKASHMSRTVIGLHFDLPDGAGAVPSVEHESSIETLIVERPRPDRFALIACGIVAGAVCGWAVRAILVAIGALP